MVEGTGFENRRRGNSSGGSNPSPSVLPFLATQQRSWSHQRRPVAQKGIMKQVPSPNSNWHPGEKITPGFSAQTTIDPSTITSAEMYRILIGSVTPRPIAFVSTISSTGVFNLAPFSFFNAISSDPPCLAVAISKRPNGERKDSHQNIIETGEFVVNVVNRWLLEPMVYAAGSFAPDVDEFSVTGLTPIPSHRVKAPRVAESSVNFECTLHRVVNLGENDAESPTTLLIGKILLAHIDAAAYVGGKINTDKLDPVGRLGGIEYALLDEKCAVAVPQLSK